MSKLGVIIANTGSPDAPDAGAVRSYLREFLTDPRIMPMSPVIWKPILDRCILPVRAPKSAQKYASIWTDEGSPLTVTQASLARKLEAAIGRERPCVVAAAGSYGTPSMEQAFARLREASCDPVVVVPLYPQSAFSTTYVVRDKASACARALQGEWSPEVRFVEPYHLDERYIAALLARIREAGFGERASDEILFAFHGVPRCNIEQGDAYEDQVIETVITLVDALGVAPGRWGLGFQCRFDRGRTWLGPSTRTALEHLVDDAGDGERPGRIFVVAPNFAIDCLETLYDIDVELREMHEEMLAERGFAAQASDFAYVPCLNDEDDHADILAHLVRKEAERASAA